MKNIFKKLLFVTVGFPVAAASAVRRTFASWPDWWYQVSLGFVGVLGLRLHDTPVAVWWKRWPTRIVAWFLCLAGLIWLITLLKVLPGGGALILLVPILLCGKYFARPADPASEPVWNKRSFRLHLVPLDWLSLSLVAIVTLLLWVGRSKIVPMAPDGYYHVLVARRIVEDGAIPLWDWWEYAPFGRPHLYPPLLHVLFAIGSLPFGGDVVQGMQLVCAFLYPGVLLTTWYFTRWLLDARYAFAALLILGLDFLFCVLGIFGLPSILANALLPLLLMLFLSQRAWWAGVMLALMFYTHLGVAPLAMVGLLIFALWLPGYRPTFLVTAVFGIVLALPWYARILYHHAWMGHPLRDSMPLIQATIFKLVWLLNINLVIVLLVLRARKLVPWAQTRYRLILCQLAGFLPMFLEYGGRYFMHTVQLWSIIAAVPVVHLLQSPLRKRRVALFLVMALCPIVMLSHVEGTAFLRFSPAPPGAFMPLVMALSNKTELEQGDKPGKISYADAQKLGAYLRTVSQPDQVIHILGQGELAVVVAFHADRPVDSAAWPEVCQPEDVTRLRAIAQSGAPGVYVSFHKEDMPPQAHVTQVGPAFVGTISGA